MGFRSHLFLNEFERSAVGFNSLSRSHCDPYVSDVVDTLSDQFSSMSLLRPKPRLIPPTLPSSHQVFSFFFCFISLFHIFKSFVFSSVSLLCFTFSFTNFMFLFWCGFFSLSGLMVLKLIRDCMEKGPSWNRFMNFIFRGSAKTR